jgi:DNA-binding response OmpR family regulator
MVTKTKNARVLFVEDDAEIGDVLKMYLTIRGYQVTTLTDGQQALEDIRASIDRRQPYDILVFDYDIPGINGYNLAHLLRKDSVCAPILVITGHDVTRTELMQQPGIVSDVLLKTFSPEELESTIDRLLNRPINPIDRQEENYRNN